MRGEFARLGVKPQSLANALMDGLQAPQFRAFLDTGDELCGLLPPKRVDGLEPQLERPGLDAFEFIGDFAGQSVIDVADEAQSDVVVFAVEPAGADTPPRMRSRSKATSGGISTPVNKRGMAGLL